MGPAGKFQIHMLFQDVESQIHPLPSSQQIEQSHLQDQRELQTLI